jgi:hypothetical protein
MMQSHQRLSQYKIQNYENKIIQRLQIFFNLFWDHHCIFPISLSHFGYHVKTPWFICSKILSIQLFGFLFDYELWRMLFLRLYWYHLVDTSAGGLLVDKNIIRLVDIYGKCRTMNPSTNTSTTSTNRGINPVLVIQSLDI